MYEIQVANITPILEDIVEDSKVAVLDEFEDYYNIYDDEEALSAPINKEAKYTIETTKDPPFGLLYNLSVKELKILRKYLNDALKIDGFDILLV